MSPKPLTTKDRAKQFLHKLFEEDVCPSPLHIRTRPLNHVTGLQETKPETSYKSTF